MTKKNFAQTRIFRAPFQYENSPLPVAVSGWLKFYQTARHLCHLSHGPDCRK